MSMRYYISTDNVLDGGDYYYSTIRCGPIAGGGYRPVSYNINIPALAPGSYYILFVPDYFNVVSETNETNNVGYAPFEITLFKNATLSATSQEKPSRWRPKHLVRSP